MQPEISQRQFQNWIRGFRTKAIQNGISGATYDRLLSGVKFSPDVVAKDRDQPENTRPIWQYLDNAVSPQRVAAGRVALAENKQLLQKIEREYGTSPEIITAIWGLESAHGTIRGDFEVLRSLASLACEGRRAALFEAELIGALQILQSGEVSEKKMRGSWAGAMGHTQLMPTSFQEYAVDFDCDGKRNIWADDPCDALASTGAYLAASGWQTGAPVFAEIDVPDSFDHALSGLDIIKPVADWKKRGVTLPENFDARGSILVPAGVRGPAFIVFENFRVLLQYNAALPYALAVGIMANQLSDAPALRAGWPRYEPTMDQGQRRELQQLLCHRGYDTKGVDGIFGPGTFSALRRFQTAQGATADGYPTLEILKHLQR